MSLKDYIKEKHFIIIVAEGLKITSQITAKITEKTGIESRATILGYVQRGGSPTAADRVLASKMGCYAVELIENNIYNKVIAIKNNKIININISEALNYKSHFDIDTYKKALEISI